jgi:hypothetical protein
MPGRGLEGDGRVWRPSEMCGVRGCARPASKGTGARVRDAAPVVGVCVPHAREARAGIRFTETGDRPRGKRGPRRRRPIDLGDGTTLLPLYGPKGTPRFAVIDTADLALVEALKWVAEPRERTTYARCSTRGPYFGARLHQFLMGAPPSCGVSVDHINRDGLDNRRSNLRWATPTEQAGNRSLPRGRVSRQSVSRRRRAKRGA